MSVKVIASLSLFSAERKEFECEAGTVSEILRKIDPEKACGSGWRVAVNGDAVTDFGTEACDGDIIIVRLVPEGDAGSASKAGGAVLATIGVIVSVSAGWTGVGGFLGAALIGTGVALLASGGVLMNYGIPSLKDRESPQQDPSVRSSRNQMRKGGYLPVLFGTRRIYADLAASSYTWVDPADGSQYLYQLFCAGQKDMEIDTSTVKIDETLLSGFSATGSMEKILSGEDPLINMRISYGEEAPPMMERCVHEDQLNTKLVNRTQEGASGEIVRTTPDRTEEINVDIFFYNGLGRYNDEGDLEEAAVTVTAWYRRSDEPYSDYQLLGHFSGQSDTVRASRLKTLRHAVHRKGLAPAAYTVRIVRETPDSDDPKVIDDVYVGSVRALKGEPPVRGERCRMLTLVGLRIKATEKLNNVVDQLNFVATAVLPSYSGNGTGEESWVPRKTGNPASAAVYALRGEFAQQRIPPQDICWSQMERLHEWCEKHGYSCNEYVTDESTVSGILASIGSTCRAEILKLNGKISVVQDVERDGFVQMFTPRNSWGYQESIQKADVPDALAMRFCDREAGYAENELNVYNTPDGNRKAEPETVQDVPLWGVTDSVQARRLGMYRYAVTKNRPVIYSFSADIEYMLCCKGDWIKYAGDIALTGISQGRIESLVYEGGMITGFVPDERLEIPDSTGYAVRIRRRDASAVIFGVSNSAGGAVLFSSPVPPSSGIGDGDLFMFGKRGQESADLIVTDIQCDENLSARITCVDYSPEIFRVDRDDFVLPEFESNITPVPRVIDSGEISGWKTWTTFNESEEMPQRPEGDGTGGGWHRVQTSFSNWISTKQSRNALEGTWSDPIPTGSLSLGGIMSGETVIHSPDRASGISAAAQKEGIAVSWDSAGLGPSNAILKYAVLIKKSGGRQAELSTRTNSLLYEFDRTDDGYPEAESLAGWTVCVKAVNIYGKESEWSGDIPVGTDGYGTWELSASSVHVRISDRTVTLLLSQRPRSDGREVYGTIRHHVRIQCPERGDIEFYRPNESADPYADEANYKSGDDTGSVSCDSVYIQTLPLRGQTDSRIEDTLYRFEAYAFNEAGQSREGSVVNATAVCTSIRDIVKANETAKEAYISELSAISANLGVIKSGSLTGSDSNYWALTTVTDEKTGRKFLEGAVRFGLKNQYLMGVPVTNHRGEITDYRLYFKGGNITLGADESVMEGEMIVQENAGSLDRTRITPNGTFYEHRNYSDGQWMLIASQTTAGLITQYVHSKKSLVIANSGIASRRKAGLDIGKPYLSGSSEVYHFDTDLMNQKGISSYELAVKDGSSAELVGQDRKGNIDFTPAILAVAPYSEIGNSLYGIYSLKFDLGNGSQWTVDFWIKYFYAEGQVLFDIGTAQDRVQLVLVSSEPNYNQPRGEEPPYNYETALPDGFVYNHAIQRRNEIYIRHYGASSFEIVRTESLGVSYTERDWKHIAVTLTKDSINVYLDRAGKSFARYSADSSGGSAVINDAEHSFILDELMMDRAADETEDSFVRTTEDKIPWGSLDASRDSHFILYAENPDDFHTNIFDTDLFKEKVRKLIQEDRNNE